MDDSSSTTNIACITFGQKLRTKFSENGDRSVTFNFIVSFQKVKEIAKMLFINAGQIDNKLEAKLKKQEIVFDTAVFHFELLFDNKVIETIKH